MADALYFIHALSSVHAGTGQGIDAIDLPIARERSTSLPLIPGSSLKGCLRDQARAEGRDLSEINTIFGPEKGKEDARGYAGSISVSDGQILLLPVRSLAGTFVWTTSPYVLARLKRDAQSCGITTPELPAAPQDQDALVADASVLLDNLGNRLVLEEYDFAGKSDPKVQTWAAWLAKSIFPAAEDGAFREALQKRLVILSDRAFFGLTRTATEIQAHIAISHNTGTVEDGALWYQESLPAETVLVGLLRGAKPRSGGPALTDADVVNKALPTSARLQIGGKAGTGQGWVRLARVAAGGAA